MQLKIADASAPRTAAAAQTIRFAIRARVSANAAARAINGVAAECDAIRRTNANAIARPIAVDARPTNFAIR
jgi:hypothetical protein